MVEDRFKKLAEELAKYYNEAYEIYKIEVANIINNKVTDIDYIENILDSCLDIYTEKGFYLFLLLHRKVRGLISRFLPSSFAYHSHLYFF